MSTDTVAETSGPALGAARALARFLFPSRCLVCGDRRLERFGQGGVCPVCWQAVELPPQPRCGVCDEPLGDETAEICGRCLLRPPPFSALRAAAPYRGAARDILLAFKFRGADYLARHLAALMIRRLPPPRGVAEVLAVPSTRRARRGNDHAAEMLGAAVAAALHLPFATRRLEKVRETERQSRLPLDRRAQNVRGAFRTRGAGRGAVLLVDDVATSGATARECALRLRRAGASDVLVWCFARASRQDADLEPAETAGGDPGEQVREARRPSRH